MFAGLAVMLCTAMVIIVMSVMGGFLDMLQTSAKQLTGDVIVSNFSLSGFPHYEQMMLEIEELPEVEAATPMVRSFGLLQMGNRTQPVLVEGIDAETFTKVVPYQASLHWTVESLEKRRAEGMNHPSETKEVESLYQQWGEFGKTLDEVKIDESNIPTMVMGIELSKRHDRDEKGRYAWQNTAVGRNPVLTVVPLTDRGSLGAYEPARRQMLVVNEFKSGLYEVDEQTVFVDFGWLQRQLEMHASQTQSFDPETGQYMDEWVTTPARINEIAIRAAEGVTPQEVADKVKPIVDAMWDEHLDMPLLSVLTWEQRHIHMLSAVTKEKNMVTFLFGVIGIVAVVMVAVTFYTTVVQKTRDVGTLRAIGAGRGGILLMFLGYGGALGLVGALLGLLLAWLIVTNLNTIQFVMANYLGVLCVVLGSALGGAMLGLIGGTIAGWFRGLSVVKLVISSLAIGLVLGLVASGVLMFKQDWTAFLNSNIRFVMWDPRSYFFDRIPDRVIFAEAIWIVVAAVISSVVGAIVPALRAALIEPVEALRYE